MPKVPRFHVDCLLGIILSSVCSSRADAQCGECLQWTSQSSSPLGLYVGAYDLINGKLFALNEAGIVHMESGGTWIDKQVSVENFRPADGRWQFAYSPTNQAMFNYVVGVMQSVTFVPESGLVVVADLPSNPTALFGSSVCEFEPRGTLLIFGGYPLLPADVRNAFVEFDPTLQTYESLVTSNAPKPRSHVALGYDAYRQRVVLFGGTEDRSSGVALDDTWEYDGDDWHLVTPLDGVRPPARMSGSMAFDRSRGVMLLVSGGLASSELRDTWEWDGERWTPRHPGPNRGLTTSSRSLAFVQHEGTFRHFDGSTSVYSLSGVGVQPPMVQPPAEPLLQGSPGTSVLLSISATGDPVGELTYQWQHNGVPITGATAANFHLGPLTEADEGDYVCVVRYATGLAYDCGATTSDPIHVEVLTQPCQSLDANRDGAVNLIDFAIFQRQFGDMCP